MIVLDYYVSINAVLEFNYNQQQQNITGRWGGGRGGE